MKLHAGARLLSAPTKPRKPAQPRWLDKAEQKQKQKPENPAKLPEGLFAEGTPAEIANTLKTKSKDYKQAMSRLNFYINRAGDTLTSQDQRRLELAKEALARAYGEEPPGEKK